MSSKKLNKTKAAVDATINAIPIDECRDILKHIINNLPDKEIRMVVKSLCHTLALQSYQKGLPSSSSGKTK